MEVANDSHRHRRSETQTSIARVDEKARLWRAREEKCALSVSRRQTQFIFRLEQCDWTVVLEMSRWLRRGRRNQLHRKASRPFQRPGDQALSGNGGREWREAASVETGRSNIDICSGLACLRCGIHGRTSRAARKVARLLHRNRLLAEREPTYRTARRLHCFSGT